MYLDKRRIILIVIVLVLLYIFYRIGNPSTTGTYDGTEDTPQSPEVFAVELPTGFFTSIYPDYDSIDQSGFMKNKDGSYLVPSKLGLSLANSDQVYQAALAKDGGVGAQFIGYGLFINGDKLQLGFPRQTMIDNVGFTTTNPAFNSTVPGVYVVYNSKEKPVTALLYALKPVQGATLKIAGKDCPVRPWFSPDQGSMITTSSIYSQNVSLNL